MDKLTLPTVNYPNLFNSFTELNKADSDNSYSFDIWEDGNLTYYQLCYNQVPITDHICEQDFISVIKAITYTKIHLI